MKNVFIFFALLFLVSPSVKAATMPAPGVEKLSAEKLLSKARARYAAGDFAGSAQLYRAIPRQSAAFSRSREELAWAYLRAGDWSALEGILVHLNTQLIPLASRLEGRVLGAINALHSCSYDKVQTEMHLFQNEISPYAKKIDSVIDSKNFKKMTAREKTQWNNQHALVLEAITKMRFVKMELLSQLQRLEKFRTKRDVLAETHQVAGLDNRVALEALNTQKEKKWIYPGDRDLWVDELFTLRSLPSSQCESLKKNP